MTHDVFTRTYDTTDPRLGRHVRHDSRSLAYLAPEPRKADTIAPVQWDSHAPVFDQGQIGSCTGNAAAKCLTYGPLWSTPAQTLISTTDADLDERFAVQVYSAATRLDNARGVYPPDDTGSDGLSVAKAVQAMGLISGYTHATSIGALLLALQAGPVIVGTEWTEDMYDPTPAGAILNTTGAVEGGHEYVIAGYDPAAGLLRMQNSWGTGWGQGGCAYFRVADFARLLARQGDCTVFTPLDQPAPTPAPTPAPSDAKAAWLAYAPGWAAARHVGSNAQMARLTNAYLGGNP